MPVRFTRPTSRCGSARDRRLQAPTTPSIVKSRYNEVRDSSRGHIEWVDDLTQSVTAFLTEHHPAPRRELGSRPASVDYGWRRPNYP
jgi:hypothetical protein